MACRFPGSVDYREFWQNLLLQVDSVTEIPETRWDTERFYSPDKQIANKSVSKWGGLLEGIDEFDHRFFKIRAEEAHGMDPQHRILLQETWHCIEDSAIPVGNLRSKITSLYVGVMSSDYLQESSTPGRITDRYAALGNYDGLAANRVSSSLGLKGSSLSVDATHASSMVALHKARMCILHEGSDYALAAGVNLSFHPWKYI